jgi:NAD(P)H-hydrate epimerase
MLWNTGTEVTVFILDFGHKGTQDFQSNLTRLHEFPQVLIHFIQDESHFPPIHENTIVIDALFGSGLNRSLEGVTEKLVQHINHSPAKVIAIDIPSGMFVDRSSVKSTCIEADHTLSFQVTKPAFLFAENEKRTGKLHILDIGLHPDYYHSVSARYEMISIELARKIYHPRQQFAHKGNFGHALLLAGSAGKMGAAVLAARACLRSGVGLLTCKIPKEEIPIMQTAVPEAMIMTGEAPLSVFKTIGIGPGIGTASHMKKMLRQVLDEFTLPVIVDADGLNIISGEKELLNNLASLSILTPHPKEFERLFGPSPDEFARVELALEKAKQHNVIIVLKGHHTFIALPGEENPSGYFNSTGNPGMATAGSGDVLTGVLTSLLAQGYAPREAAILGVFLHGFAGDLAAENLSQEALIASDIIDNLAPAFRAL